MSRRALTLVVGLVSILAVFAVYFGFYGKNDKDISVKTQAASGSATLTSQAEWTAGTNVNTDLASTPGSVKISNTASSALDMYPIYLADPSRLVASINPADAPNVIDNDLGTWWRMGIGGPSTQTWQFDLGQNYSTNNAEITSTVPASNFSISTNGVDWTIKCANFGPLPASPCSYAFAQTRYIKFSFPQSPVVDEGVADLKIYTPASATHTSGTTQLDAGAHITMNWTTFVPSGTIPANTSINFRFRSSINGSDWSNWSNSTPYAASIDLDAALGDTDKTKRYLQVETTLANTDGASTPTLDAYTANYEYPVLDHVVISPDDENLVPGELQTYTGIAYDDSSAVLPGVTWAWSATGGTITSGGVYTAGSTPGDYVITGSVTYDGITKTDTAPVHISDSGCNVRIFPKNCPRGQGTGCPEGPGYFLAILPHYWWDYSVTTTTDSGATRDDVTYSWSFDNWAGWTLTPSADGKSSIIRVGSEWNPQAGWFGGSVNVSASCGGSDTSSYFTYYGTRGGGGDETESCKLTVTPEFTSLFAQENNGAKTKENFVVQARNKDDKVLAGKTYNWTTSGGGTLTQNGSSAEYIAKQRGSWTINATSEGCDPASAAVTVGEIYCPNGNCGGDDGTTDGGKACIGPLCLTENEICFGGSCLVLSASGAASVNSSLLALAAILALLSTLAANSVDALTTVRSSQLFSLLFKGRERKKTGKFGIVYDADSGMSIPLAKVLLFRARDKKLISAATSGRDGRFSLVIPVGEEYFVAIGKDGFSALKKESTMFRRSTLKYQNNYFGQVFRPKSETTVFDQAVPLVMNSAVIPLLKNASTWEKFSKVLRLINIPLAILGFIFSIMVLKVSNTIFNKAVFWAYLLVFAYWLINYLLLKGRTYGIVIKTRDKNPVDLAVIRAISESSGKLTRTSLSNQKGHYLLTLPRGFYKLLVAKPSLEQASPLAIRVQSSFTPRKEKIGMREIERVESSQLPVASSRLPDGKKLDTENRTFDDAREIVENYQEKNKKYGTADLSNLGVHHLIKEDKAESSDAPTEKSEVGVPTESVGKDKEVGQLTIPDEKPAKTQYPNWQFPSPRPPM